MPIHLLDLPVEIIDLIVEKACAGQRYEGHLTSNMPAGLLLVTCRALYPIARQKLWQHVQLFSLNFLLDRTSMAKVIALSVRICDSIARFSIEIPLCRDDPPDVDDDERSEFDWIPEGVQRTAARRLTVAAVALLSRCRRLEQLHIIIGMQYEEWSELASLIFVVLSSMPACLRHLAVDIQCFSHHAAADCQAFLTEAVQPHLPTLRGLDYRLDTGWSQGHPSGHVPHISFSPLFAAPKLERLSLALPSSFSPTDAPPMESLRHLTMFRPYLPWVHNICTTIGYNITSLTLEHIPNIALIPDPADSSNIRINLPRLRHLRLVFASAIDDGTVGRYLTPFAASSVAKLVLVLKSSVTPSAANRALAHIFDTAIVPLCQQPDQFTAISHLALDLVRIGSKGDPPNTVPTEHNLRGRIESFASNLMASDIHFDVDWGVVEW